MSFNLRGRFFLFFQKGQVHVDLLRLITDYALLLVAEILQLRPVGLLAQCVDLEKVVLFLGHFEVLSQIVGVLVHFQSD